MGRGDHLRAVQPGEKFDYVVSVCDETAAEYCGMLEAHVDVLYGRSAQRIRWSVPDFASLVGTDKERMAAAREIRHQIKSEVLAFLARMGIETASR